MRVGCEQRRRYDILGYGSLKRRTDRGAVNKRGKDGAVIGRSE